MWKSYACWSPLWQTPFLSSRWAYSMGVLQIVPMGLAGVTSVSFEWFFHLFSLLFFIFVFSICKSLKISSFIWKKEKDDILCCTLRTWELVRYSPIWSWKRFSFCKMDNFFSLYSGCDVNKPQVLFSSLPSLFSYFCSSISYRKS